MKPLEADPALNSYAVRDLQVLRAGQPALRVDHLDIPAGEVLAIIGPNGAGKSTLLLALGRLIDPSDGEIRFGGAPLAGLDDLVYRRKLALVLQEPLLLDRSVFDNVAAGLRFRKWRREEVHSQVEFWLDRFGIGSLSARPARRLSGGEAQRVSLARAFAVRPEVMLLDEPFSALDAPSRASLLADFQETLKSVQMTTIFVTHDQNEALSLGDRVAVILGGALRQVGRPDEVFAAPADEEVAAFVGVETVLPGAVMNGQEGRLIVDVNGLALEAVGALQPGRQVLFCLRPEDITLWPPGQIPRSSSRNQVGGHIRRMDPRGPLVQVTVEGAIPLVSLITRASASELGFAPGQEVIATFKATAVHLIPR